MSSLFRKINRLEWAVLALTLVFVLGTLWWFRTTGPGEEVTLVETGRGPDVGETWTRPEKPEAPGILEGEILDLNLASEQDLTRLPGIGEKKAAAIVAWREAHGAFQTVEDLISVDGIGETILEGLRPYVTVGGPAEPEGGT